MSDSAFIHESPVIVMLRAVAASSAAGMWMLRFAQLAQDNDTSAEQASRLKRWDALPQAAVTVQLPDQPAWRTRRWMRAHADGDDAA